ncbi:OVARIAN TUMOR DOMAIN-containing deubiquitinating enzyme 5 [Sesamum angolense]|uniref:OVARIAN TUMOR DOMAIN-containing deubiquitinating enzyme 5 n=1 Tax=Sesamum angolense TaxID=2727404 RepID=A0AAE2BYC1_9LAMI|nr:OVARIAN TUMOR DOMAIN-containing deubiquitinating enzyme 5 [Sesamum angolense]
MKKAAAKGSKAEQKAKKKQVDEEIHRLSTKLKERQAEELALLGYSSTTDKQKGNLDNLVKAIAGVSVTNHVEQSKPSKSNKRREKRAQQEAAREQRIQEEQSQIVSDRLIENESLEQKLEPLGFTINEIKPMGTASTELSRISWPSTLVALLLILTKSFGKWWLLICGNMQRIFFHFSSQRIWQMENQRTPLQKGSFPDVEMGKEYKSGYETGPSSPSIMLSYHRHAFGLGEHYNSVVPSSVR